jgi:uncharacterized membrane protein
MIAALTFPGAAWWWVALAAAVVLAPLAWLALAPAGRMSRTLAVGLGLRTLGIGLLLICLLDPQWTSKRAVRGANMFAVLADNSQSLQVADTGITATRGRELANTLTGPGSAWLAELAETFQVRPYTFDRETRRVRDFSTLDFTGERSDLAQALLRLRERFAGQPLAGVLLFTDGNATDITDMVPDLAGLPPVYPVVVGAGPVRDVRLERVTVRQTAFDDAPVSLQADVAGHGFDGASVQVAVRPLGGAGITTGEKPPETQHVRLRNGDKPLPVTFTWRPRGSGVQFYEVAVTAGDDKEPLDEATPFNNRRVAMVDRGRPAFRILYVGGRPSWEFKFLNRALVEDPQLQMAGLLRIARREPKFEFKGRSGEASNPIYRGFGDKEEAPRYDQPVLVRVNARDEAELRGGFPRTAEELYAYDAVILDYVESAFFAPEQLALLRQFAAERGGGLLALGGADSLDNGDYADSPLAGALPVYLDRRSTTVPQGNLRWKLTREGWLEPWARVRANETDERARLEAMPPLLVANGLAAIKPGATVLAQVEDDTGTRFPALVAQNFGAGRVACLTAGDMWRWGLKDESDQADLARFWRQLVRWLVTDVPAQVTLQVRTASDDASGVRLLVTARDQRYHPVDVANARLTVRRLDAPKPPAPALAAETATEAATAAPATAAHDSGFSSVTLTPEPVADAPGQFSASFPGRDAGAYLAEVDVTTPDGKPLGRAQTGWVVDSSAEEFASLTPNRTALAEIARRTGGEVIAESELPAFVRELPNRDVPVAEAWSYPIWNTAAVFLIVLACFLAEWTWRRWRGLP